MKILIAPWGEPSNWKESIYKFEGEKVSSKSSLRIIKEIIKPDKTFILISDTLAFLGNNFEEIKAVAKEKVKKFCEENSIEDVEIFVLPGIGIYGKKNNKNEEEEINFKGFATDYYYSMIYNLTKEIEDLIEKNQDIETIELHLDATHGVNFMPVFTYKVVREIGEILAMFYPNKVSLTVYNSDPFKEGKELNINKIEHSKLTPNPLKETMKDKKLFMYSKDFDNERKKSIGKMISNRINHKSISAFIGSIFNGLPLALFTYFPDTKELKSIIDKVYSIFEEYIVVERKEKLFRLYRPIGFYKNFGILTFTWFIARIFEIKNLINKAELDVDLDTLKNIRETFFKDYDRKLDIIISNELQSLEKSLQNSLQQEDWTLLNLVLSNNTDNEDFISQKNSSPHNRNFLAHAGFERNMVETKKIGDKIYFRYKNLEEESLLKFCQEGLT